MLIHLKYDLLDLELLEYELIIISTSIFIPSVKKLIKKYTPDSNFKSFSVMIINQYTNWNLFLIAINLLHSNIYLEYFITINSSTIFIIYHVFYLKDLIKITHDTQSYYNHLLMNIANIFMHILPLIYYFNHYLDKKTIINFNIGYHSCLFNLIWSLQVVGSYDACSIYYRIKKYQIYITWYSVCFLHIFIGFIANYYLLLIM